MRFSCPEYGRRVTAYSEYGEGHGPDNECIRASQFQHVWRLLSAMGQPRRPFRSCHDSECPRSTHSKSSGKILNKMLPVLREAGLRCSKNFGFHYVRGRGNQSQAKPGFAVPLEPADAREAKLAYAPMMSAGHVFLFNMLGFRVATLEKASHEQNYLGVLHNIPSLSDSVPRSRVVTRAWAEVWPRMRPPACVHWPS